VASFGAIAVTACAARTTVVAPKADLARAEQLLTAGCYTCLTEALAIYEQAGQRQAASETALLIVMREKELGIPEDASLAKARTLAASTLVELAEHTPVEPTGQDPDQYAQRNSRERRARIGELRATLETQAPPSLVTTYLKVSFDCDDPKVRPLLKAEAILAPHGDATILRYRLALCGVGSRDTLDEIRAADPRWSEIAFFQGRRAAAARPPNLRGAIDLYNVAVAAFPKSAAIVLALAHAQRAYGDLEPALDSYDKALVLVPTNREALLGRVITLSYLERHPDAIATATRMIDLGTWLMGDAYYWRARSRYILKSLEEAWDDAEKAVKLSANTNVYTLAGVIAYDRKELDVAKDRFDSARRMDASNCTAHSYFALVQAAQNNWPEATPVFSRAMTCFIDAATQARRDVAELEAATFDPVYKNRLIAQQEKTIKESDLKAAQAGYNAAQGFLRSGNKSEAMAHLQIALEHPEVHEQAETLSKLIGR
jgi:tetratricopeptide (TPR) repeat protein